MTDKELADKLHYIFETELSDIFTQLIRRGWDIKLCLNSTSLADYTYLKNTSGFVVSKKVTPYNE